MKGKDILISRAQTIRDVAKNAGVSINLTKTVFDSIESVLKKYLRMANKDRNVDVCLFKGLHVRSWYQYPREHSFLGDNIVVSERIKAKAMLSRYYIEDINKNKESD